ncbi:MAG: FprA family A-type flavoprotein [Tissierellia bacterium]|nr:FprA family A-type flavoprotein [Tissierellia bacterium]
MAYRKMGKDIWNIGVSDRRINMFENILPLNNGVGVAYNSYIQVDEDAIVLIDSVDSAVLREWRDSINDIIGDRKIDYFIIQHIEPDHCAGIAEVLKDFPDCKVIGNSKSFQFLKQFYHYDAIQEGQAIVIKEGDVLETKNHKYHFVFAPMVHWPEVFVTYDSVDKRLFSADAFGGFKAIAGNYWADEVDMTEWLPEMRRYYINIVGRHGKPVQQLFKKVGDLGIEIKEIFPLHALCFRDEENIKMIMEKYVTWSTYVPEDKGVVMVYASMYGNSKDLAEEFAILLAERGIKNIQMFDISQTDPTVIMTKLFQYSHAVFNMINYNTNLYFPMHNLLNELLHTNWQNRKYALMVSKSWGGQAEKQAQEMFAQMPNIQQMGETFNILSRRTPEQWDDLVKLADEVAKDFFEA